MMVPSAVRTWGSLRFGAKVAQVSDNSPRRRKTFSFSRLRSFGTFCEVRDSRDANNGLNVRDRVARGSREWRDSCYPGIHASFWPSGPAVEFIVAASVSMSNGDIGLP